MVDQDIDLCAKVCPYVVMNIVRDVELMEKGQTFKFVVDDPLAVKSIPEELEEYDDMECVIEKQGHCWSITVIRH